MLTVSMLWHNICQYTHHSICGIIWYKLWQKILLIYTHYGICVIIWYMLWHIYTLWYMLYIYTLWYMWYIHYDIGYRIYTHYGIWYGIYTHFGMRQTTTEEHTIRYTRKCTCRNSLVDCKWIFISIPYPATEICLLCILLRWLIKGYT